MPMTLIESRSTVAERRPMTVVVADDHDLYRAGIVREIEDCHRDFELIGQAADGHAALALIVAEQPDLALLDVRMPELDGLALCGQLTALRVRTRVVILSAFTDAELVWLAKASGAAGYLDKGTPFAEVRSALLRAADGEHVYSRPALSSLNAGPPALD